MVRKVRAQYLDFCCQSARQDFFKSQDFLDLLLMVPHKLNKAILAHGEVKPAIYVYTLNAFRYIVKNVFIEKSGLCRFFIL